MLRALKQCKDCQKRTTVSQVIAERSRQKSQISVGKNFNTVILTIEYEGLSFFVFLNHLEISRQFLETTFEIKIAILSDPPSHVGIL